MKVVRIILGVLLFIGGVYCIFTPVATYGALAVIIGLSMVVEGISGIITWNSARKLGHANGWTLAGAILSVVLGAFVLGSYALQFAVDTFIAFIIAFWLIEAGIVRIATAVAVRNELGAERASGWVVELILGILIVIFGVLCVFNPLSIMVGVGFMLGASIALLGAELIVSGLQER